MLQAILFSRAKQWDGTLLWQAANPEGKNSKGISPLKTWFFSFERKNDFIKNTELSHLFLRTTKTKEKSYDEMAMILKAKITISDDEVKDQYTEFMSIYPDGKITLEEFTEMFGNKVVFSPESIFRYNDISQAGSRNSTKLDY